MGRRRIWDVLVAFASVGSIVDVVGGCATNHCGPDETRLQVMSSRGEAASPQEFVCLPAVAKVPADGTSSPPSPSISTSVSPPSYVTATPLPGSSTGDAGSVVDAGTAAPLCQVASPGELDVRLVARLGAPPQPRGIPPDGAYVLVQANAFAGDGGTLPSFDELRATLKVTGVRLDLSAQVTAPTLEPVESITTAVAAGLLMTICDLGAGGASRALLPGPGATETASLGWDGQVIDLVIATVHGPVDLIFAPS
jgi:hypothetical protein